MTNSSFGRTSSMIVLAMMFDILFSLRKPLSTTLNQHKRQSRRPFFSLHFSPSQTKHLVWYNDWSARRTAAFWVFFLKKQKTKNKNHSFFQNLSNKDVFSAASFTRAFAGADCGSSGRRRTGNRSTVFVIWLVAIGHKRTVDRRMTFGARETFDVICIAQSTNNLFFKKKQEKQQQIPFWDNERRSNKSRTPIPCPAKARNKKERKGGEKKSNNQTFFLLVFFLLFALLHVWQSSGLRSSSAHFLCHGAPERSRKEPSILQRHLEHTKHSGW